MEERYLNPSVDYGFKKLFGTEENKDLLISLLNALIGGKDPIINLIYKNVELPKLDNVELDLNTPQGRWLYALNSLYYYDQKPEKLKDAVFDKLFRQAEIAQFTPEQDLEYERSMKVYLDTYNQLKGAHILGQQEGSA